MNIKAEIGNYQIIFKGFLDYLEKHNTYSRRKEILFDKISRNYYHELRGLSTLPDEKIKEHAEKQIQFVIQLREEWVEANIDEGNAILEITKYCSEENE